MSKPKTREIRIPTVREWRMRRDQAGILHGIIVKIPRGSLRKQAWQIFHQWQEEEITFKEAEKKLRELARQGSSQA